MSKVQKSFFILRTKISKTRSLFRNFYWKAQGMKVGTRTFLPQIHVTWPNQVAIGSGCSLQRDIYFHFDGVWKQDPSIVIGNHCFIGAMCEFNITKKLTIGNDCLIASGTKFIDHNHGVALDSLMRVQNCPADEITIGNNVWIGANVVILKGVTIADGAIIAAGAVLNKNVGANEIWGGIPAKKISERR